LGGVAAWLGAVRLHILHSSRVHWMSAFIPGQNMVSLALAFMPSTPP
jgi:hypothetical protein